jgi:hypothetical protein
MTEKDNPIADQSEKLPKAPELAGASLEKPPVSRMVVGKQKEPAAPVSPDARFAPETRFPFGSFVHEYIWGSILLAEQKAAFIFAADTAFIGYLVATIPTDFGHLQMSLMAILVCAFSLLIGSISATVSIVMPRLGGDLRGMIYFKAVASRPTAADYMSEVLRANRPELDSATMQHIYEIATICTRKYERVRWALWLGLFGFIAGFLWILLLHTMTLHNSIGSPDPFSF